MRNNLKKVMVLLVAAILMMGTALTVYAEDVSTTDSAGNVFFAGDDVEISSGTFFGGFGAGTNVSFVNSVADDSIALAGMNVKFVSSSAVSSVYLAGNSVVVSDSIIGGNIVAAGASVVVDSDTISKSVIAFGTKIEVDGSSSALTLVGEEVVINGTVEGDVTVDATTVKIGENAVITGTLKVTANNEPVIASGAKVAATEYNQVVSNTQEKTVSTSEKIIDWIVGLIKSIIATVILGLLMFWLINPQLDEAKEMLATRAGVILGTGAVTLIVAPIIMIILFIVALIGIPGISFAAGSVTFILLVLYVLALFTADAFAGASIGRLIFKNMKKLPASVLGIVILVVASEIPILGAIISVAVSIYSLGYLVQWFWRQRNRKSRSVEEILEETACEVKAVEDKSMTE